MTIVHVLLIAILVVNTAQLVLQAVEMAGRKQGTITRVPKMRASVPPDPGPTRVRRHAQDYPERV